MRSEAEFLMEMEVFADIPRIKELRVKDGDTLLAVPNFPMRGESDRIIHGPDIILSAIQLIEQNLRTCVRRILEVRFKEPVRENSPLFVTPNANDPILNNSYVSGQLEVKHGKKLSFAVLKEPFGDGSEKIILPENMGPFFCCSGCSIDYFLTEAKWRLYVSALSTPNMTGWLAVENLIQVGNRFVDAYQLTRPTRRIRRAFFTRLGNLDLVRFKEDGMYDFNLQLQESVDKGSKIFLNFTYTIDEPNGNQVTKGDFSACLICSTEVGAI